MEISASVHRPVHFYVSGACYFITAATLYHQPILRAPARREWFLGQLQSLVTEIGGELLAWVILPDHYHVVIRIRDGRSIPQLMFRLHGISAHRFNAADARPSRQVWFSYWDRCLWTEGDFWSRINYIHGNPVKHGYVETPDQWAHSSWRQFADPDLADEAVAGLKRFPAPRQLPNDS